MTEKELLLGKANYEAYAKSRTYGLPPWDQLTTTSQASWISGALGVLREAGRQKTG